MEESLSEKKAGKIARIIGIVAIVCVIVAAMIISFTHKVPNSEKVWDKDTTVGNMDAENYFIIYSDIACPYCVAFENAIVEHEEEFQKYIEENDVLVEIRLSDYLYEYGQTNPISSKYGAEATYCAKKEGRFWDYYNLVIATVWKDFFGALGKSAYSSLNAKDKNYWIDLGKGIGFSEDFKKCVQNDETLPEIKENARKTVEYISGLPYFKFNKYILEGFSLDQGWDHVLNHFNLGLKRK